jgi:hypothetical protein
MTLKAFIFTGLCMLSAAHLAGQIQLTFTVEILDAPQHGIDYLPAEVHVATDGERFRVREIGTDVNRTWLQTAPDSYAVLFSFLGHEVALVENCRQDGDAPCWWPAWPGVKDAPLAFEVVDGPARYRMVETARHDISAKEWRQFNFVVPSTHTRIDRPTLSALLSDLRPR